MEDNATSGAESYEADRWLSSNESQGVLKGIPQFIILEFPGILSQG